MNRCENCGASVFPGASDCTKCGRVFGEVKSSSTEKVVIAGVGFLARLAGWLLVGGFLTLGPGLLHGIEKTAGWSVLIGAFVSWATLPFTGLAALSNPSVTSQRVLNINRFIWYAFLSVLYLRMCIPNS